MEFEHKSVLLNETIDGLNIKPDGIYVDGTLGGGGHAYEVCRRLGTKGSIVGIDQDAAAIEAAGMAATVGFIFLILPFILRAYNLSDLTAETTRQIIHFHGISAVLIWPLAFTLPGTFRASGDAKTCMIISITSMWIFRIAFSYILGKYLDMGVFGVWVAMVIDWVFRTICFIIRYFRGNWKKDAIV